MVRQVREYLTFHRSYNSTREVLMFDIDSAFERAKTNVKANTRSPLEPRVVSGVPVTRNDIFDDESKYDTTPVSKRQVKNRSGRAGRRMWNGQRWIQAVGGYKDDVQAIYAPADQDLCVVVDSRRGFRPDGTPFRF